MAKQWYGNNEDSLGFQSSSHQRPVSSIDDKSTPKSNGWALGQDIDADESCTAVSPDLVLASLCEDSPPVPAGRHNGVVRTYPTLHAQGREKEGKGVDGKY